MGRVLWVVLAVAGLLPVFGAAPAGATVIVVTTTADSTATDMQCSLREAITSANTDMPVDNCFVGSALPLDDRIVFAIGSGTPTISLATPLPTVTEQLTIAGDQGAGSATRVELNGASAGTGAVGLRIDASNSVVEAMVINRFQSDGVAIVSGTNNKVVGSFIGTDAAGSSDSVGNQGDGVNITGGTGHAIGGTVGVTPGGACTGECNVISGNSGTGVFSASTGSTSIKGNFIGGDAAGTGILQGGASGVVLQGAGHTVGGLTPAERNVIASNYATGITIANATADHNTVVGNYIGTDTGGAARRPNRLGGVVIGDASFNTVGGGVAGARNVISGNNSYGVYIYGAEGHNVVAGNIIGLKADGAATLFNAGDGVQAQNATDNTIGGDTPGERNVISGNNGEGVNINQAASARNVVSGNYIGTDITGTVDLGNSTNGIDIAGTDNVVGGTTGVTSGGSCTGECNLVSGNLVGVNVGNGAATSHNTILGNYIGTSANGSADLGNSASGVQITDPATGTTVGGTSAAARNVIAGNDAQGVRIVNATSGNSVLGNSIGLTASGGALPNSGPGVQIDPGLGPGPTGNTIGGDSAAAENVISNHATAAIRVTGDGTDNNVIARNRGAANALFVDVGSPDGPGNDAGTGANGGIQAPAVTGAGATGAQGTAAAGSTVRVFRTTVAAGANVTGLAGFAGSATADGSGHWVVHYETAPGASETVAASQTTIFGTSELTTATGLDPVPPDTAIVSGPADGSATADNTPTFGFESEPNATFECKVDGADFTACSNPHTLDALADGEHTLRVRAVDTNLNPDPVPASRTFTVDASVPDTQITTAPPAVGRSATVTTAFSSTETNAHFECKLDGGAFTQCLSPDTRPVGEGAHVFQVRAVDGVGNVDATPASAAFRIDRTRPVASKFGLRKSTVKVGRSGNAFRFRLTEVARAVITIEQRKGRKFVRRGRLVRGSARAGQNSVTFKGKLGSSKLKPGTYRASLVATDAAGNSSRVRRVAFRVAR